jgi:hypothetical protein
MRTRHLLTALMLGLCASFHGFSQGSFAINVPNPNGAEGDTAGTYKLIASEQKLMDSLVLPKARKRLAGGACEEEVTISGRHQGAFTRADASETAIFYQFCQTGNGLGSAGIAIVSGGKLVGNFIAENAGWTLDSSVLPDINANGLNEIELYYSGGMHQGAGGVGVDIVEYSAGKMKGIGWYQAEGFGEGPSWAVKVTVDTGKTPVFFKEKYVANKAGKWHKSGKVLPLKLGPVVGPFEVLK